MSFWISTRESIRWLETSPIPQEPTDTIVITDSATGLFVDVRFRKDQPDVLDWAIAGIRRSVNDKITFVHIVDSHIPEFPLQKPVEESCVNSTLPDGRILEQGEMLNPETNAVEAYEEIWIDKEVTRGTVKRNEAGNVWTAHAEDFQIGLGIENGRIWAYLIHTGHQKHATEGVPEGYLR